MTEQIFKLIVRKPTSEEWTIYEKIFHLPFMPFKGMELCLNDYIADAHNIKQNFYEPINVVLSPAWSPEDEAFIAWLKPTKLGEKEFGSLKRPEFFNSQSLTIRDRDVFKYPDEAHIIKALDKAGWTKLKSSFEDDPDNGALIYDRDVLRYRNALAIFKDSMNAELTEDQAQEDDT